MNIYFHFILVHLIAVNKINNHPNIFITNITNKVVKPDKWWYHKHPDLYNVYFLYKIFFSIYKKDLLTLKELFLKSHIRSFPTSKSVTWRPVANYEGRTYNEVTWANWIPEAGWAGGRAVYFGCKLPARDLISCSRLPVADSVNTGIAKNSNVLTSQN